MRGFYMDEAFTGSPSDLEHISHDTNFTAKQWVDNTSASLAPIESTSIASQPYTVGKRLVYGGRLYKVTQAIAKGGTLTPGTNITEDNVSSEFDEINANLTAMMQTSYEDIPTESYSSARNPLSIADSMLQEGYYHRIKYVSVHNPSAYPEGAPVWHSMYVLAQNGDTITLMTIGYNNGYIYTNGKQKTGTWTGWRVITATPIS